MITMGKGRLRLGTLSTVVHDGKPFPAYMPPRALLSGNTMDGITIIQLLVGLLTLVAAHG